MLSIRTFGKLSVQWDSKGLAGLHSGKFLELFCYLLLQRDRFHSREALATLFWADFTTAQSRKYLRQALWQLQAIFCDADSPNLLQVTRDSVRLNLERGDWLDVAVFENAYLRVKCIPSNDLDEAQAQLLKDAVNLYCGDLLEGWYQDWCLFERERLQNIYLSVLEKLMCYCGKSGEYEAGIEYGERSLRLDRAHERSHQEMMRLYYLAGDRVGAIRQYKRCEAALWEELGVKPGPRTTLLLGQIRDDRENSPALGKTTESTSESTSPEGVIPRLFARLLRLRSLLDDMQAQLQTEIQAVEKILPSYTKPASIPPASSRSKAS